MMTFIKAYYTVHMLTNVLYNSFFILFFLLFTISKLLTVSNIIHPINILSLPRTPTQGERLILPDGFTWAVP